MVGASGRIAAPPGELVNEAELYWPHIAEEIESMGRAEQDQLISRLAVPLALSRRFTGPPDHAVSVGGDLIPINYLIEV